MQRADPPARLPQVEPGSLSPDARDFLGRWTGGIFKNADSNPVLLTYAHHPALADAFSTFNIHLLSATTLPVRLRQIAIMRTAWITRATYMWSSHLNTSARCGLEPEVFEAIKVGAEDPYFDSFERVVLRATDDLINDRKIGDRNWADLSAQWNEQQMLDFIFTVGCYVLTAGFMRSTGVRRQQDLIELAGKYGEP